MARSDRDDDSIGPETEPVKPGESTDEATTEVNPEHHQSPTDVNPPDDEVEESGADLERNPTGGS